MATAGYSGTPLVKKLGIKPGSRVHFANAPEHLDDLLGELPDGVKVLGRPSKPLDFAHVFVTRRRDLEQRLPGLHEKLAPDGALWVSWPKKAAKVATDMTEDVVREVALPRGLVDVKVAAVDDTWSGLKLVIRRELRG